MANAAAAVGRRLLTRAAVWVVSDHLQRLQTVDEGRIAREHGFARIRKVCPARSPNPDSGVAGCYPAGQIAVASVALTLQSPGRKMRLLLLAPYVLVIAPQ